MTVQSLTILGATGSIGQSTIDVVMRHPDRYRVHALSGHTRIVELAKAALRTQAACILVPDADAADQFRSEWPGGARLPEIRVGAQALIETAASDESDIVMAAIVGVAGLPAVFAAATAGKRILLANKESLVAAGSLLTSAVRRHGATLLPIDSEHNAIFQCMPTEESAHGGIRKVILTASGGPFRQTPIENLENVTPQQACAHPNWEMGQKISVDSATMLNKGLEVIEAHWLFSMPPEQIDVVIHPQSIVHSLVQYIDGSMLAQLGNPDMRTPIAHALGFPERIEAGVDMLDLAQSGHLAFERVDYGRYPCLSLAFDALRSGQGACIVLNAANEVAVQKFLEHKGGYLSIARVVRDTLDWYEGQSNAPLNCLDDVLSMDRLARQYASSCYGC